MSATEYDPQQQSVRDAIQWVAHCDYLVDVPEVIGAVGARHFSRHRRASGTELKTRGLCAFVRDDATYRYYATYTAFDGTRILPQLIETEDFLSFRLRPLHGAAARNKGMALFPRRIGGRYAMFGRQGGVNITLMFSDDVHQWDEL